ncbi:hypothetical protein BDFB_015341, partial [Asbolus verrucosus]
MPGMNSVRSFLMI